MNPSKKRKINHVDREIHPVDHATIPSQSNKLSVNHDGKLNLAHDASIQRFPINQGEINVVPPSIKNDEHLPAAASCSIESGEKWGCSQCTYLNLCYMAYCEICESPKSASTLHVNGDGQVDLTKTSTDIALDGNLKHLQQPIKQFSDAECRDILAAHHISVNTNPKPDAINKEKIKDFNEISGHVDQPIELEQLELARQLEKQWNEQKRLKQREDEVIARQLQKQWNQQRIADESKEKECDEKLARKLQAELEAKEKEEMQKSELLAMKMQMEEQKEEMKRERERIEGEKVALQLESEQYQQRMKEEEERKRKERAQSERDAELAKAMALKSEEWVKQRFNLTMGSVKTIVSVTNVSDSKNHEIYEKILTEKLKNGQKREEIEKWLWHGTKQLVNIDLIIRNGFDRSYNTTSQYGRGTYFARDAAYSVNNGYCGRDANGVHSVLLCKVIVGEYTKGHSGITAIPRKPDGSEFDSLVDNLQNPGIFVIWRDYHACPAFLVKYK